MYFMRYFQLFILLISFAMLSSCLGDGKDGEKSQKAAKEDLKKEFIAMMTDLSRYAALVDAFKYSEADFKKAYTDATILAMYSIAKARMDDGFCFVEDKTYVDSTLFRIATLRKSGIPDDQQKPCPISIRAIAEKRTPTAGVNRWVREVNLSDGETRENGGKSINYSITANEDPKLAQNKIDYDLTGTVNTSNKLTGHGVFKSSTNAGQFDSEHVNECETPSKWI